MEIEQTFAYVKPDAMAGKHLGAVLARAEDEGFRVERVATYTFTGEDVDRLYAEHVGRDFYPALREFTTSGPSAILVLSRRDAVAHWRRVLGATDPREARRYAESTCLPRDQWSLRALYGDQAGAVYRNVAHGSATPADAARELGLAESWFLRAAYGKAPTRHPTSEVLGAICNEFDAAHAESPKNARLLAALVEEVGELAEAHAAGDREAVRLEAVQVAALAARIHDEGDRTHYQLDGLLEVTVASGRLAHGLLQGDVPATVTACQAIRRAADRIALGGDATFGEAE